MGRPEKYGEKTAQNNDKRMGYKQMARGYVAQTITKMVQNKKRKYRVLKLLQELKKIHISSKSKDKLPPT